MALIVQRQIVPDVLIGVWKVEETQQELLVRYPYLQSVAERFRNPRRRLEKLSVYALLHALLPDEPFLSISHNPDGKPLLDKWNISISDTKGYVAVMLSRSHRVGIDVEYQSDRVSRIASRFLRADELFSDAPSQLVVWCSKEAFYKCFSEQHLEYADMRALSLPLGQSGMLEMQNMRTDEVCSVAYFFQTDFVLAFLYC
ncbi:MAG: 4'-phosphopantetheinyl transferase superfamily protein [Prevotella sp.]|nr:4'-phosphopantetheinyl transferase superfamily protein [Prevotella sp.]